jgi:hypothetical protein
MMKKQRSFSPIEYGLLQADGLAPKGLPRQCPKCNVWAHYEGLEKRKRGTCKLFECPSCGHEFEIIKGQK